MGRIELSIIICVYNGQDTIASAIESAVSQGALNDFEVIIVDDASSDRTNDICQAYAESFSNIRILRHDENKRLLEARRTGVNAARGFRITFLDADDYLRPGLVDYCSHLADDIDILQMPISMVGSKSCSSELLEQYKQELTVCNDVDAYGTEVMAAMFNGELARRYVWGKLIKADVAKAAYSIIPDDSIFFAEDCYANIALASKAERYIDDEYAPAYCYVVGMGGTHVDMTEFAKYEEFCHESHKVAMLIKQLADREQLWDDYSGELGIVLDLLTCSTLDRIKTTLPDSQWAKAFDLIASLWDPVRITTRLAELHWHTAYSFFDRIASASGLSEIGGPEYRVGLYQTEKRFDEHTRDDMDIAKNLGLSEKIVTTIVDTKGPSDSGKALLESPWLLGPADYEGRGRGLAEIVQRNSIDTVLYMNWINPWMNWDVLLLKLLGVRVFLVTNGELGSFLGDEASIARTASAFKICDRIICMTKSDAAYWLAFNPRVSTINGEAGNAQVDLKGIMDAHVRCVEGYRIRYDNYAQNSAAMIDALVQESQMPITRRILNSVAPVGTKRRRLLSATYAYIKLDTK